MAIGNFMDSMAESQMLSGCHFFKVVVENEVEYVLIAQSASEEAYMIGRLAALPDPQYRTVLPGTV